jgi:NAD(P)H-nitrite reductase large subunit
MNDPSSADPRPDPPPEGIVQEGDRATARVCYCMHVHEATIRRAIARGADSIRLIGEWTRAGLGCGTCRSEIAKLLQQARDSEG